MAEAKVDITVAVEDAGLKRLNTSLASGQQHAKALKTELKNLERETQSGTKATEAQRAALQDLQQQLNVQTEANKRYSKAIKEAYNSALKRQKERMDPVLRSRLWRDACSRESMLRPL